MEIARAADTERLLPEPKLEGNGEVNPQPEDGAKPVAKEDTEANVLVLMPDTSVYQDPVFMPLVQGFVQGLGPQGLGWAPSFRLYYKSTWLLILNIILQFFMAFKMLEVTGTTQGDFKTTIFSLCTDVVSDSMPWWPKGTLIPGKPYYDCGPLTMNVLASIDYLDVNKDGAWTLDEALNFDKRSYVVGNRIPMFEKAFWSINLFRDAKGNVSKAIPLTWLHENAAVLKLCSIQEPSLCGNVELQGFLSAAFPEMRGKEPRVAACEDLFEADGMCMVILGSRFRYYVEHRKTLCGPATWEWDEEARISSVKYATAQQWSLNSDSIVSVPFISFLLLIIVVWFMLMLGEFHELMRWAVVLFLIPTFRPTASNTEAHMKSEAGPFSAVPAFHRNFVLLAVWLPRCIIFCLTTWVGTVFLASSTDYINLLLNATALGFLIEIDQMLHAACTDDRTRQQVAACSALSVKSTNRVMQFHQDGFSILYSAILIVASSTVVLFLYDNKDGNVQMSKALLCICQAEGDNCLASAILQTIKRVVG